MPSSTDPAPTDLLRVDDELSDEERLVRDTVRKFAADRILPDIADWFEAGTLPKELFPEIGKLGLLGMHLKGYGCAGHGRHRLRRRVPGTRGRRLRSAQPGLRPGLPGHVPDLEVRIGRAEGGVAAPDGRRRGGRLLRADGAGSRFRSRRA